MPRFLRSVPTRPAAALAASTIVALSGCAASAVDDAVDSGNDSTTTVDVAAPTESGTAAVGELGAVGTLTSSETHTIEIDVDTDDVAAMVDTYLSTGDKDWIEATVTIDGERFEQVGMRLKGNSSLRDVSADADPVTLPWLIRLDKYVDGQTLDGLTDLVLRSNNTASALNEAVALELLSLAGLASQDAIGVAFTVNGGEPTYRLVIEHPEDAWMSESFGDSGALYKAESTGDYSYRGTDPDAYDEVFDQEAGDDNADLTPLIDFLDFINNSDDHAFVEQLSDWLDVDAFATYLAMQELVENFDDIDGPGNNSYLYYDPVAEQFTVVAWDLNLAFGVMNGGPGGQGGAGPRGDFDGDRPAVPGAGDPSDDGGLPVPGDASAGSDDLDPGLPDTTGRARPGGGQMGGPAGSNVLTERFLANTEWSALVADRTEELRAELFDSGVAASTLATWTEIVESTSLVSSADVDADAARVASHF